MTQRKMSLVVEIRKEDVRLSTIRSVIDVEHNKHEAMNNQVQGKTALMEKLNGDHLVRVENLQAEYDKRGERLELDFRDKKASLELRVKEFEASLVANYNAKKAALEGEHEQIVDRLEYDAAEKTRELEEQISNLKQRSDQHRTIIATLTPIKSNLDRAVGNIEEIDRRVGPSRVLSRVTMLVTSPQTMVEHPKILFRFMIPVLDALLSYVGQKKDRMINVRSIQEALENLLSEMNKVESGQTAVI